MSKLILLQPAISSRLDEDTRKRGEYAYLLYGRGRSASLRFASDIVFAQSRTTSDEPEVADAQGYAS